jgi:hypothetical protein
MNSRREQVWVGLFVLAAATPSEPCSPWRHLQPWQLPHRAYFKFAGGLAGSCGPIWSMKAGSVKAVHVDGRLGPDRGRLQPGSRHPVEGR